MAEGIFWQEAFVSFFIFRQIISTLKPSCYQDMYRFPVQAKTYLWITQFFPSKCTAIVYVQKSNLFPERSNSGKMHRKCIQKNTINRISMPHISQLAVLSSSLALDAQRHGSLCMEQQLSTKKIISYFFFLQGKKKSWKCEKKPPTKQPTNKRFSCESFQMYDLVLKATWLWGPNEDLF